MWISKVGQCTQLSRMPQAKFRRRLEKSHPCPKWSGGGAEINAAQSLRSGDD